MELNSKKIVLLDHGRKPAAVFAFRYCRGQQWHPERVREIYKRPGGDIAQKPGGSVAKFQLIPSHMGGFDRSRKALAFARPESQAGYVRGFLTGVDHPLHADADAEKRHSA